MNLIWERRVKDVEFFKNLEMFALLLILMYGVSLFGFLIIFYIDNCNSLCEIIFYLLSLINQFTFLIFFRAMSRLHPRYV